MKINASNMMISSSQSFTQTIEREFQINLNFSNLLDQQLVSGTNAKKPIELKSLTMPWGTTYFPGWFDHISKSDNYHDQYSDSFTGELGKLGQMLNMFFENLLLSGNNNTSSEPTQLQLTRIRNVAMNRTDIQHYNQLSYSYDETLISRYQHMEEAGLSGDAILRTKDGRTINFSYDVGLEEKYSWENQFGWSQTSQYQSMEVLNLDTPLPSFNAAVFDFNLNMGQKAEPPDEPIQGSGFLKLATYDPTQHLWVSIDDTIYNNLPIWERNENG